MQIVHSLVHWILFGLLRICKHLSIQTKLSAKSVAIRCGYLSVSGRSVGVVAVTAAAAIAWGPELVVVRAAVVRSGVRRVVTRPTIVWVRVVVGRVPHPVTRWFESGLHWIHVVDDAGASHRLTDELHHRPWRQVGGHLHWLLWNVAHDVVDSCNDKSSNKFLCLCANFSDDHQTCV